MPRTRIAHTIGDWEKLTHVVTPETTAGSPYLEQAHAKLQGFLDEVNRLHVSGPSIRRASRRRRGGSTRSWRRDGGSPPTSAGCSRWSWASTARS